MFLANGMYFPCIFHKKSAAGSADSKAGKHRAELQNVYPLGKEVKLVLSKVFTIFWQGVSKLQ